MTEKESDGMLQAGFCFLHAGSPIAVSSAFPEEIAVYSSWMFSGRFLGIGCSTMGLDTVIVQLYIGLWESERMRLVPCAIVTVFPPSFNVSVFSRTPGDCVGEGRGAVNNLSSGATHCDGYVSSTGYPARTHSS